VNFYSGGGNITMHGYSSNAGSNDDENIGINQYGGLFIDAGTGRVRMIGEGENFYGINLNQSPPEGLKLNISSAATSGDAIYMRGVSGSELGLVFNFSSNKELKATGGGNITLEGVGGGASQGIFLQTIDVLATSGTITLDGGTNGIFNKNTANTYGFKAGSDITSSSSDIIFRGDVISVEAGGTATSFNTTGTVTVEPSGTSFTSELSFPISNLSLDAAVSGLTLGKASNTADMTIASATSIAGPISVYGGTITLDANLTTTNGGDISLYTDNALGGLTTSRTLTAAGAFKYIPRGTTFSADVTYPITNLTASSTGLTIGNATNDKNITINSDVTGDAGIELFGNDIDINANLETTNSANLEFKGNTTIAAGKHIASNGDFTHDGDLLFKSDATNGDAYLGSIDGSYTKTSGTVITEKYYPAKRAFRMVASPVDGGSLFDNWQNGGANETGIGTHITGEVGTVGEHNSTTGLDYTISGNPSMFYFDSGWQAVADSKNRDLEAGVRSRRALSFDGTWRSWN
jgi:hypothetical protein